MINSRHPRVFIIILNWNGKDDTLECLESVYKLDYPNFTVVVVDNGSTDGSPTAIREAFPEVTSIENGANLGFAAGNNVGIRYALEHDADYIWLLNNDTTIKTDSLAKLVAFAEGHPHVGMLSPTIHYYSEPDTVWFAGGRIDWQNAIGWHLYDAHVFNNLPVHERYLTGCAVLVRQEVINRIGPLDERFFLYFEDTDWSFRSFEAGYDLAVVPGSMIFHKSSKSVGKKSPRYWFYISQSRLKFMKKHKSRFGRFYLMSYVAISIRDSQSLYRHDALASSNAVLDALFESFSIFPFLHYQTTRDIIRKVIRWHPYFLANLLEFKWKAVIIALRKKVLTSLSL
jgi:GT2 family glycosyltransferase